MQKKKTVQVKKKTEKLGKVDMKPAPVNSTDLWFNIFMSIFGISLFFSGVQSLGFSMGNSAQILAVVAALSGGMVLGLSLAKMWGRKRG